MIIFALPLLIPVAFVFAFFAMPFIVYDKCNKFIESYPNYKILFNVLKVLGVIFTTIPILIVLSYIVPVISNSFSILFNF